MSTEGRRAGGRNRNRNRKDKKHDDMAGLACSGLLEEAFYAWWVGGNGACEKSHRLRWLFRFHGFVRSNELAVIAAADNRAACDRGVWASFFCGLLIFFFLKGGDAVFSSLACVLSFSSVFVQLDHLWSVG